jgi:probable HAF family extracellular repeat protein
MVDLGVLSAEVDDDTSFAEGINNFGQAAGGSRVEGQTHAFLWTPNVANGNTGSMVDLGRLGNVGSSTGRAVNATGTVVGESYNDVDGDQAFVWTPDSPNGTTGTMSALPILPLAEGGSYANNINDNGQIVGYGPQELLNERRAYLWSTPSSPQDLGVLPGDLTSSAVDINNLGHVVGMSDGESGLRAFLWMEGVGMLDLNSLVNSTGNGWNLTQGISINDAGQILGIGFDPDGNSRGFLLTPVPEPSSILLAMISAGALWSLRRRLAVCRRSSEV